MAAIMPHLERQNDPSESNAERRYRARGVCSDEVQVSGLSGLGDAGTGYQVAAEADAMLQTSHAELVRTAWTRKAVEDALQGNKFWLERDGRDVNIVLENVVGLDPRWNQPGSGDLKRASLLSWTQKMGTPSFSIPAGPPQSGGSCPGAVAGQTIVPAWQLIRGARQVKTIHDTGAYSGMGPYVVDKNSILIGGPFYIPNIRIDGTCVYTNKPPASSMRGFGIINGTSAEQLQMDRIAETIGMDPWEIRFINAWRDGDLGATQFKVEAAGLIEAMKRAAELAGVKLPAHLQAMSSRGR